MVSEHSSDARERSRPKADQVRSIVPSAFVKVPLLVDQVKQPLSTQVSIDPAPRARQKFYSQTEINEAEEDLPDEEIADEIPDQLEYDDTEDEREHHISDDDGEG